MRDLLVCKQCEKFEPLLLKYPKVDTVLKGWFEWNNVASCHRMHGCFNDDFSVRHGDYLKDTEYFNLDNSKRTCPYFVEHEMYSFNSKESKVDYGFFRRFKLKRTCQHCGRVIPNRKKCPVCGYDRFKPFGRIERYIVEHKETARQFVLISIIVFWITVYIVSVIGVSYLKWQKIQKRNQTETVEKAKK